ncbi:hypothetical protein Agub_g8629 [Astrephomene gubernaculifera]|uniref:Uncharacterized protein n=1 Tax=Astrephomene gubernaculifera TaxID=47775 RepID=A0AAD3DUP0_9CHLO|nr:hypothetical protein Agub_g8629 [Astrephomene gubernaculifera]
MVRTVLGWLASGNSINNNDSSSGGGCADASAVWWAACGPTGMTPLHLLAADAAETCNVEEAGPAAAAALPYGTYATTDADEGADDADYGDGCGGVGEDVAGGDYAALLRWVLRSFPAAVAVWSGARDAAGRTPAMLWEALGGREEQLGATVATAAVLASGLEEQEDVEKDASTTSSAHSLAPSSSVPVVAIASPIDTPTVSIAAAAAAAVAVAKAGAAPWDHQASSSANPSCNPHHQPQPAPRPLPPWLQPSLRQLLLLSIRGFPDTDAEDLSQEQHQPQQHQRQQDCANSTRQHEQRGAGRLHAESGGGALPYDTCWRRMYGMLRSGREERRYVSYVTAATAPCTALWLVLMVLAHAAAYCKSLSTGEARQAAIGGAAYFLSLLLMLLRPRRYAVWREPLMLGCLLGRTGCRLLMVVAPGAFRMSDAVVKYVLTGLDLLLDGFMEGAFEQARFKFISVARLVEWPITAAFMLVHGVRQSYGEALLRSAAVSGTGLVMSVFMDLSLRAAYIRQRRRAAAAGGGGAGAAGGGRAVMVAGGVSSGADGCLLGKHKCE